MDAKAVLCPQDELDAPMGLLGENGPGAIDALARLEVRYPKDPRVPFLLGSALAAESQFDAARGAFSRAVDLAPDFVVARFQLGFLDYTAGRFDQALDVWAPLHRLAPDHYLRLFVRGLDFFGRDKFDEARQTLERGIAANTENPSLNNNIRLLLANAPVGPSADDPSDVSAAHLLLQQFSSQSRH